MNNDWTIEFRAKYPTMFANTHRCNFHCGEGWMPILDKLCTAALTLDPAIEICQIKEKFGTLRFYPERVSENIREAMYVLINAAEAETAHTCEECGAEGVQHNLRGWLTTLCEGCLTKEPK